MMDAISTGAMVLTLAATAAVLAWALRTSSTAGDEETTVQLKRQLEARYPPRRSTVTRDPVIGRDFAQGRGKYGQ